MKHHQLKLGRGHPSMFMTKNVWAKIAVPQSEASIRFKRVELDRFLMDIKFNVDNTSLHSTRIDTDPRFVQLCVGITVLGWSLPLLRGQVI